LDTIRWHFNPPAAPSQGGIWESCVKLVKTHLRKLIADESYTYEEFETIIIFIEGILNSRPLTPVSDDPLDLEALTPAHFLTGPSPLTLFENDYTHIRLNRLDRYQLVIRRQQDLWRRWQLDYITALQKRDKWTKLKPNVQIGDMVLIIDDQTPALHWKIGRIKDIHPGDDGVVRVTTIETDTSYEPTSRGQLIKTSKQMIRPITKLVRLPMRHDDNSDCSPRTPADTTTSSITTAVKKSCRISIPAWHWLYTILSIVASVPINHASSCVANLHQPNSSRSSDLFPISDTRTTNIVAAILLVFSVLGVIGNVVTIVAILLSPRLRRNHVHWFVISLCASDLLFSATTLPMTTVRYLHRGWIFGSLLCKLYAFSLYGNVICSLANILAITVNRYIKVVYFPWYPLRCTDQTVLLTIGIIWLSSFGALLPSFVGLWGDLGPKTRSQSVYYSS